jgi:hypothetical protein
VAVVFGGAPSADCMPHVIVRLRAVLRGTAFCTLVDVRRTLYARRRASRVARRELLGAGTVGRLHLQQLVGTRRQVYAFMHVLPAIHECKERDLPATATAVAPRAL